MFDNNTHLQVFKWPNEHVGHFDGEHFYPTGSVNLRVDGDEIYTLEIPTRFVGNVIKEGDIYLLKDVQGNVLFELRE
ncbi:MULTISPECIES: hypothetical protein [Aeromonas]|uniref:hypothetical protein n=1 Tax=Aeromonas TaxID=642 RepID=UPI0012692BC9|nr:MULTISPECIES: hypothetical protein [Aeromonas]MEA9443062.1 hypothetical protein [Aeromonas caviae]